MANIIKKTPTLPVTKNNYQVSKIVNKTVVGMNLNPSKNTIKVSNATPKR